MEQPILLTATSKAFPAVCENDVENPKMFHPAVVGTGELLYTCVAPEIYELKVLFPSKAKLAATSFIQIVIEELVPSLVVEVL